MLGFQPHRYTRTEALFEDFASVLSSRCVVVLEVYPAGEKPIAGADRRSLSRGVRSRGKVNPIFVESIAEVPKVLQTVVNEGDIVLLQGAGNIGTVPEQLIKQFGSKDE